MNTEKTTTSYEPIPLMGKPEGGNSFDAIFALFLGQKVTHKSFAAGTYIYHKPNADPDLRWLDAGVFLKQDNTSNGPSVFYFGASELSFSSGWKPAE